MAHARHLTVFALFILAVTAIALSAVTLARISGSHEERYQGDWINAFSSGRWVINEHGETRFTLTALRPTDLRCLDEHQDEAEQNCEFERVTVLDTPASWILQPIRPSERWGSRPSFENGELWVVVSHVLAPERTPVECTSEEGKVTSYSRTVSDDGSIWCKAQFKRSVDDPRLTIRVGNATYEATAP